MTDECDDIKSTDCKALKVISSFSDRERLHNIVKICSNIKVHLLGLNINRGDITKGVITKYSISYI